MGPKPKGLLGLPPELLLKSLMKTSPQGLCQMRKTCKFMDGFAQLYEDDLSERPELGVLVSLSAVKNGQRQTEIRLSKFQSDTVIIDEHFSLNLSAVAIKFLRVTFPPEADATQFPLFTNILKSLPHCISAWVGPTTTPQLLGQIMDSINVRDEIIFDISSFNTRRIVPFLINSVNVRMITVQCEDGRRQQPYPALFNDVKVFKTFHHITRIGDFHNILWEINASTGALSNITLLKVSFSLPNTSLDLGFPFVFAPNPKPLLSPLWDMKIDSSNRGVHEKPAAAIFLWDLHDKFAVLVNSYCIYETKMNEIAVEIHFIEHNLLKVLDFVAQELGIKPITGVLREDFVNGKGRKVDIIRKAYNAEKNP